MQREWWRARTWEPAWKMALWSPDGRQAKCWKGEKHKAAPQGRGRPPPGEWSGEDAGRHWQQQVMLCLGRSVWRML